MRAAALCLALAWLLVVQPAAASDLLLAQPVEAAFAPQRGLFLLETEDGLAEFDAVLAKLPGEGTRYLAVTQLSGMGSAGSYHLLLYGGREEFAVIGPQPLEDDHESARVLELAALPKQLERERETVAKLEAQAAAAAASLQQLQLQAGTSEGMQKAQQVEAEAEAAEAKAQAAARDVADLERLLQIVQRTKEPYNFHKRERLLTSQLAALAQAAKSAESAETGRRNVDEADQERRRSLIEETRFENVETLEQELAQLKAERAELEKKSQPAPTP